MAIRRTKLQSSRMVDQIKITLLNLQEDLRTNAMTHKVWAQTQAIPLEQLRSYISDCVKTYNNLIGRIDAVSGDPEKKKRFDDALAVMGWSSSDIAEPLQDCRQAVAKLAAADISSYQTIIKACNEIIDFVDPLESIHP